MIAAVYDAMVDEFVRGQLDWEQDEIKVMLVTGEYDPDQARDRTRADVGPEVPPSGTYKAGGQVLRDRAVDAEPGLTRLVGGSVTWVDFTGRFRYAVIYQHRGAPSQDGLVAFTDLGDQQLSNARVNLQYQDAGICEFAVAPPL